MAEAIRKEYLDCRCEKCGKLGIGTKEISMREITVSDQTFEALQQLAGPNDTHDTVIQRYLPAKSAVFPNTTVTPPSPPSNGKKPGVARRARRGERTPVGVIREALVHVLKEAKEAGKEWLRTYEATERVGEALQGKLKKIDYEKTTTGEVRWVNTLRFARIELVKEGVLDGTAPHGVWRLKR